MNMTYGKNGLDLTKSFEQCRLKPYKDSGGVWTNGWGNTHHVDPQLTITQDQADADLERNVQDAVDCVNDNVQVPLTQNQFDALVDFTFNVGAGAFRSSALLKRLNQGDYAGVYDELDRWDKVKGVQIAGLVRRRDADQALWNLA